MHHILSRMTALLFTLLAAFSFEAKAQTPLEGPVLITLELPGGAIVELDRSRMQALDWREIVSFTAYSEGPQVFAGPTLSSLLSEYGMDGATLQAVALDDYAIEIPATDATEHGVLLAVDRNGSPMRVRDKGPVWIIYPAPTEADLNDANSAKMVWQLKTLVISK